MSDEISERDRNISSEYFLHIGSGIETLFPNISNKTDHFCVIHPVSPQLFLTASQTAEDEADTAWTKNRLQETTASQTLQVARRTFVEEAAPPGARDDKKM